MLSSVGRAVLCSLGMLGTRLAAARARAGLTQAALAAALGPRYDQAMISRVEAGHKQLRFDGVVTAARTLQVSLDYLAGLTDDLEPAARLADDLAHERARVRELDDAGARLLAFARPGIQPVPLVQDAGIAAGAGAEADDEHVLSYVPFRDDWLKRHGLHAEHCRVIEVIGQSMEPTLEHHAVILVDMQRTTRRRNKIFAIRDEEGPIVKRLRHDHDGWWLDSDNTETHARSGRRVYPSRPWPQGAVVVGQVMWTGRTL